MRGPIVHNRKSCAATQPPSCAAAIAAAARAATAQNTAARTPPARDYFAAMQELVDDAAQTPPPVTAQQQRSLIFAREIAAPDRDARAMSLARSFGVKIRSRAFMKGIDLAGRNKVEPEDLAPYSFRLTRTFNTLSLSRAYKDWQAERTAQLVGILIAAQSFRRMAQDWNVMDNDNFIENASWFSRMQQSVFSHDLTASPPEILIETFSAPHIDKDKILTLGTHMRPQNEQAPFHSLTFNTHPDARLQEFDRALNVLFHENLHATQWMLAEQYVQGAITAAHPLHRDARLLMMAYNERSSYIPAITPVYRAHPLEEDTFRAAAAFIDKLAAATPLPRTGSLPPAQASQNAKGPQ